MEHKCCFISFLVIVNFLSSGDTLDLLTSKRLCPNLDWNSGPSRNVSDGLVSVPLTLFKAYNVYSFREGDAPCRNFDFYDSQTWSNDGEPFRSTRVTIRGAKVSHSPWAFGGSRVGECRHFMQLKVPLDEQPVEKPTRFCRMYRTFPLFRWKTELSNLTESTSGLWAVPPNGVGVSGTNVPNEVVGGVEKPRYLIVLFKSVRRSDQSRSCIMTVQQHLLTKKNGTCSSSKNVRLCGTYSCQEQERLLTAMGFLPFEGFLRDYSSAVKSPLGNDQFSSGSRYDLQVRGGEIYMAVKSSDPTLAGLFTALTRALSFLFILSVLISCITFQLKPYMRPSPTFGIDLEQSHQAHRRCFRRPHHAVLPYGGRDDSPSSSGSTRSHRNGRRHQSRGVTNHHHNHSENSRHVHRHRTSSEGEVPELFCQPPPPYESILPPSYDETVARDVANPSGNITETSLSTHLQTAPNAGQKTSEEATK